MTASRTVDTASSTAVFTAHSRKAGLSARSGDQRVNALLTPGREPATSDCAQARVFAAMLTAEIDAVSALVDDAEQLARTAGRVGQGTARLWHNEEARTQRRTLYELHRQLDALHRRFPDVSG
ncbi:hypothetical protein ACN9MI_25620 (plasmid) [Rhodococcoides fascians]|uniref:hypothetical protein n=1 Tax=Nocardiaceae TaxID=85025 RepID=UPI0034128EE4